MKVKVRLINSDWKALCEGCAKQVSILSEKEALELFEEKIEERTVKVEIELVNKVIMAWD